MADIDLRRFHDGYSLDFDHALSEIDGGHKRSHWMWFIFPQVAGLGSSPTAATYAIRSRAEAEAFLRDPVLGPAYRRLVDAVRTQVVDHGGGEGGEGEEEEGEWGEGGRRERGGKKGRGEGIGRGGGGGGRCQAIWR